MKHCIIMTAYKDVAMINRIIARCPDNWGIYIHLDRKSDIDESEIDSRAKVFKKYNPEIKHITVRNREEVLIIYDSNI